MEELKKSAVNLASNASTYLTTLYDHTKVQTTVKATNAISESAIIILVTSLLSFTILFIGIGAALWIGHKLQSAEAGFFIIGGAYLLISLIFFLLKKQIALPLKNFIVRKIYA